MNAEIRKFFLSYLPLEIVDKIERYLCFKHVDENGSTYHYCVVNKHILLHSKNQSRDLPAVTHKKGGREWWFYGVRHRDNDLPAIVSPNKKYWYKNGIYVKSTTKKNDRAMCFNLSVSNYFLMMKKSGTFVTYLDTMMYMCRKKQVYIIPYV